MPARRLLAAVALAVALAQPSGAATIQITDFTAPDPMLAPHGGWIWDYQNRDLLVGLTNTPSDYLQEVFFNAISIDGGTALQLTGSWTPSGADGDFRVDLKNNGFTVAEATFRFGEFASGPQTITHTLTYLRTDTTNIDQYQIVGAGNSSSAFGDIQLTDMKVITAVPEPSTLALAAAGLVYAAVVAHRRRRAATCPP